MFSVKWFKSRRNEEKPTSSAEIALKACQNWIDIGYNLEIESNGEKKIENGKQNWRHANIIYFSCWSWSFVVLELFFVWFVASIVSLWKQFIDSLIWKTVSYILCMSSYTLSHCCPCNVKRKEFFTLFPQLSSPLLASICLTHIKFGILMLTSFR